MNIVLGDITQFNADVIVNAANASLRGGGGVDGAIHKAAGKELLQECIKLGGCKVGEAKYTKGYNLPCKYVVHTVGPRYGIDYNSNETLRNCYINSLNIAKSLNAHSIVFPSISTGIYKFPLSKAAPIACAAINDWLKENSDYEIVVTLCAYDMITYRAYMEANTINNKAIPNAINK